MSTRILELSVLTYGIFFLRIFISMVLDGFPTDLGGKTTFEILVIARLKVFAQKNLLIKI